MVYTSTVTDIEYYYQALLNEIDDLASEISDNEEEGLSAVLSMVNSSEGRLRSFYNALSTRNADLVYLLENKRTGR